MKATSIRTQAAVVMTGLLAALSAPAAAQINTVYIGPNGGNWNNAANWDNGIPDNGGSTYNVFINSNGADPVQVFLDISPDIDNLSIDADDELVIDNARTLIIVGDNGGGTTGTINNAGTLTIGSTGSNTYLRPSVGPVTLTGGGTVVMSDQSVNWIYRSGTTGSLVNMDNTIRGGGRLGFVSVPMDITNHGLIVADSPVELLCQSGSQLFTNTGTLRADGGILALQGNFDSTGGLIHAADLSDVQILSGSDITGGTFATTGSGIIGPTSGTSTVRDIENTGALFVSNASTLILEGTINNSGLISLNSTGNNTYLRPIDGPVILTGGGEVVLSNSTTNWIYRTGTNGSLVNVNNTIRGAGRLGYVSVPTAITNHGLVIADAVVPLLCQSGSQLFTNDGVMRAENGGTLQLQGNFENTGGTIDARDLSAVELLSGNALVGGVFQTSDSGVVRTVTGTVTVTDVENAGLLQVSNASTLDIGGTIVNTGTIELNSIANNTYLQPLDDPVILTGGGEVIMSDSAVNWIYRASTTGSLINMDNTIRGAGRFGYTSVPTNITNHGLVVADGTNPLSCETGTAMITNDSTMRAENGGTLQLKGNFDNTGGLMEALDGSTVELVTQLDLTGGTLDTTGSGLITTSSGTAKLSNVTTSGMLRVANASILEVAGTINNTGTIELNSTVNNTYIRVVDGPVMLTGGGELVLSDVPNTNWIYRSGADGSLINVDNTIRGAGYVGYLSVPTNITNQSMVIADGTNPLRLDIGVGKMWRNEGTVQAMGAGGVSSQGGGVFLNTGTVTIDESRTFTRTSGDYVQTAGTTSVEGTLDINGSGSIIDIAGGTLLGDGIVDGPVEVTGGTLAPGLSAGLLTIQGTYVQTVDGTFFAELGGLTPGSEHDRINISGKATLGGTIRVELLDPYVPSIGHTFLILSAAQVNGTFSCRDFPALKGMTFRVQYNPTNVTLQVIAGKSDPADVNGDGSVNVDDLLAVINGWGPCPSACCPGDVNGDQVVNVDDLLAVINAWG